jgi:hypothetical protein
MLKRQKVIQVVLAGVMLLALCGVVPAVARARLAAQPTQQVAMAGMPYWGPQPEVNWNS